MTRITILFMAGLLAYNVANAQSPQVPKGPKAKNSKPWKVQTSAGIAETNEPALKGPASKNKKAWNSPNAADFFPRLNVKKSMTGPKVKNRKVWKKAKKQPDLK